MPLRGVTGSPRYSSSRGTDQAEKGNTEQDWASSCQMGAAMMGASVAKEPKGAAIADVRLQGCYFLLGMGLLAACCSIWQCMDYMKAVYDGLHPPRVLSTAYNSLYMLVVFTLFFGGPGLLPSKRGRMLTGYGMYVFALAVPPLIDTLCHRLSPPGTNLKGVMAAWAVGAAVAGAADAVISSVVYAEAAILGAAYTHAFLAGKAACGLTMAVIRCASKAALPGKEVHTLQLGTSVFLAAGALLVAVCVLIVAVVLPRLQPAVGAQEEQLIPTLTVQQTLLASHSIAMGHAVPPTAALLPRSNTLTGMMPGMEGALLLPAFTVTSSAQQQQQQQQGFGLGSVRMVLSRMDTNVALQGQQTSRLLSPTGTEMLPVWSNAYRAASCSRRRVNTTVSRSHSSSTSGTARANSGSSFSRAPRSSSGTARANSGGSFSRGQSSSSGTARANSSRSFSKGSFITRGDQGPRLYAAQRLGWGGEVATGGASDTRSNSSSSGWRFGRRGSSGLLAIPSGRSPDDRSAGETAAGAVGGGGASNWEATPLSLAQLSSPRNLQEGSSRGGVGDGTGQLPLSRGISSTSKPGNLVSSLALPSPSDAAASHGGDSSLRDQAASRGGHVALDTSSLSDAPPPAAAAVGSAEAAAAGAQDSAHDSAQSLHVLPSPPGAGPGFVPLFRDSVAPGVQASGASWSVFPWPQDAAAAGEGQDELYCLSPFFQALQQQEQVKEAGPFTKDTLLQNIDEERAEQPLSGPTLRESLRGVWLTMRVVYPYQAAAALPPLITSAILPMIFSQDFSQSVLADWYNQVAAVTYQMGGFVGSALIPIPGSLRRPRATLLAASLAMLVFVGAFAAVLKLNGGPIAFIVLAFFMYMYSGYLISCTFCLAGKGLLADDAQMVQMVLVLSTATTFVLGGFVSWAWVAVPKQ